MKDTIFQFKGTVYEEGYGLVAKKILKDNDLTVGAKALYSYLCAYAGNEGHAFPGRDLICHELDISKDTFNNYKNELLKKGYLTIMKVKNSSKQFDHNNYIIESFPCPKKPDTEKPDTEKPDTENLDTTNNNLTNNNLTNNNSTVSSSSKNQLEEIARYYSDKSAILEVNINPAEIQTMIQLISEIPVEIIKQGIDEAFKRYKPKFEGDKIKSFKYCEPIIRNLYAKYKVKESVKDGITGQDPKPNQNGYYDFSKYS